MAKRKDLRNPDILSFDYVSVLLNWKTSSPLIATPTFTVSKVLKGTFPFNTNMLSFTAVDSSSTISFVFQSPFDINTSPWQFELEIAFTATISKFRPTAVFNGSNNQITVKFNIGSLATNTSYPVVFTAKRYRPTTQYLQQLAAASQNPVTVNTTGSFTGNIIYTPTDNNSASNTITVGHYFTAPINFVINSIGLSSNSAFNGFLLATNTFIARVIKLPSFPIVNGSSTYTNLFTSAPTPANSTVPVNISINTGDVIGIFSSVFAVSVSTWVFPILSNGNAPTTCTIAGIPATVNNLYATGGNITNFTAFSTNAGQFSSSVVNITTAGGTAWSNILY